MLFRVDDLAQIRGTDPPVLCIVIEVRAGRVRVAYRAADRQPVRHWMEQTALIQCSAQYAQWGISPELLALRARRPS